MIQDYHSFELNLYPDGSEFILHYTVLPAGISPDHLPRISRQNLPNWRGLKSLRLLDIPIVGHAMYRLLFEQSVEHMFNQTLNRLRPDEGLRLCISSQATELCNAPWEILCSKLSPVKQFLALDERTPVIRCIRGGEYPNIRKLFKPLRILIVYAEPRLVQPIDPAVKELIFRLLESEQRNSVLVDYLGFDNPSEATFSRLQEKLAIQDPPYDIVHFIGHGPLAPGEEGLTALVQPVGGRQQTVTASQLGDLLKNSQVMLVILQSCYSGASDSTTSMLTGVAQVLFAKGIPAVLAMQDAIDQDVAASFIHDLYLYWIVHSTTFEQALTLARQKLNQYHANRVGCWAIPVLYMVPYTDLFRVHKYFSIPSSAERLLDAALPRKTRLGRETELVIQLRKLSAISLAELLNVHPELHEAKPEDTRTSSRFEPLFILDRRTGKELPAQLRLVIEARGFIPIHQEKIIQVSSSIDCSIWSFLFTPVEEGQGWVSISLQDYKGTSLTDLLLRSEISSAESLTFQSPMIVDESLPMAIRTAGKPFPNVPKLDQTQSRIICPYCGDRFSRFGHFCPRCGRSVDVPREQLTESHPRQYRPPDISATTINQEIRRESENQRLESRDPLPEMSIPHERVAAQRRKISFNLSCLIFFVLLAVVLALVYYFFLVK